MNDHKWELVSGDENNPRSIFRYQCSFCKRTIRCVPGILSRPDPPTAAQGYPCFLSFPSYATMPKYLVGCSA